MIKVGVFLPSEDIWAGGYNYYLRLVEVSPLLCEDLQFVVFADSKTIDTAKLFLGKCVCEFVDVGDLAGPQSLKSFFQACIWGRVGAYEEIFRRSQIDVIYTNARVVGWRSPVKLLSWIPDLQHCDLPEYFSFWHRLRRDIGFLVQSITSTRLIFSSEDSKKRFEKRYFVPEGIAELVRFSVKTERGVQNKALCDGSYILVANQWWPHKNHEFVCQALEYIATEGSALPLVVFTGRVQGSDSYKVVSNFSKSELGAESVKMVGYISRTELLNLMENSAAILNPSRYEGWNTAVEEGLSMGVRLLLSDIPIHREQAGENAIFFPLGDVPALAQAMSCSLLSEYRGSIEDYGVRVIRHVDDLNRIFRQI